MKLGGGGEAHGHKLDGLGKNLVRLGFADALDVDEVLLRSVGDGLDRVEPGLLQFAAVVGADAAGLPHPTA